MIKEKILDLNQWKKSGAPYVKRSTNIGCGTVILEDVIYAMANIYFHNVLLGMHVNGAVVRTIPRTDAIPQMDYYLKWEKWRNAIDVIELDILQHIVPPIVGGDRGMVGGTEEEGGEDLEEEGNNTLNK